MNEGAGAGGGGDAMMSQNVEETYTATRSRDEATEMTRNQPVKEGKGIQRRHGMHACEELGQPQVVQMPNR
jgi:hypothetical protein